MPKFVDDLHVAGAVTASADPAKITHTLQKAVGQTVDIEQVLDTDGTTVKAKVDSSFIATYPALAASGLTGATQASRYVGATTSGAPTSGTFAKGDFIIDQTGRIYICTTSGSPGTWAALAGATALSDGRAVPSGGSTNIGVPGVDLININQSAFTMSGNRTSYLPFLVTATISVDQWVCEVTTAVASCNVRFAIYTAGADMQPVALVAGSDSGDISAATTGVKTASLTPVSLTAGRYVIWTNCSTGNPVFRAVLGGEKYAGLLPTLGSNMLMSQAYVGKTYSAPPSTPDLWTTTAASNNPMAYYAFLRTSTP